MLICMMKNLAYVVTLSICFGSVMACAQATGPTGPAAAGPAPKVETEDQKTLYALGLLLGRNVQAFGLTPEELAIVKAGLTDAATNAKPQVELETYGPKVNEMVQKRAAAGASATKQQGQAFADKVA